MDKTKIKKRVREWPILIKKVPWMVQIKGYEKSENCVLEWHQFNVSIWWGFWNTNKGLKWLFVELLLFIDKPQNDQFYIFLCICTSPVLSHKRYLFYCLCVWEREREIERQRQTDRKGETEILKSISNISFSLSPYHFGSSLSLSLSATAITCDNIFQTFCCLWVYRKNWHSHLLRCQTHG